MSWRLQDAKKKAQIERKRKREAKTAEKKQRAEARADKKAEKASKKADKAEKRKAEGGQVWPGPRWVHLITCDPFLWT